IPCLLRYPGHIAPRRFEQALVQQIDLYPTLLDYANIPAPRGVQGESLRPLFQGERDEFRSEVYAEICPPDYRNPYRSAEEFLAEWRRARHVEGHPLRWTAPFNVPGDYMKMIRTHTRKYVWYANGEEELYDLQLDPGETLNRAAHAGYAAERADLQRRLFTWYALSEDPLDPRDARRFAQEYPWRTA
ncbi:MAG: hypothetical protein QHJ73_19085, partial [Armatimonadota bacterium]|nr:hypothetical protein [Armatimonadota bacterium]